MALFGKKETKHYLVFDPYTEEVVASCNTADLKQIRQVLAQAKYVECSEYEVFKYKEHKVIPGDFVSRKKLEFKDIK